jgi:hypothetical protein
MELFDIFCNTQIPIPVGQLMLLIILSTLSMLYGKIRLALLGNYIFTYYWAYVYNRDLILELAPEFFETFTYCYFGFGILSVCLTLFAFMMNQES